MEQQPDHLFDDGPEYDPWWNFVVETGDVIKLEMLVGACQIIKRWPGSFGDYALLSEIEMLRLANQSTETCVEIMVQAACQGRLDVLKSLIKGPVTTMDALAVNMSMLRAAEHHRMDAVEWLVREAGANINFSWLGGTTALHLAAASGRLDMVMQLVEAGSAIDQRDVFWNTAFFVAAQEGHWPVVEWLFKFDQSSVNATNRRRYTPLMLAVENGRLSVVHGLVNHCGASTSNADGYGHTAMHIAASLANHLYVDILMTSGAKPNEIGVKGRSSLHIAAKFGHVSTMQSLLRNCEVADINQLDKYGATPLYLAASKGDYAMVKLLVDDGRADIRKAAINGRKIADDRNHEDCAGYLNNHIDNFV